MSYFKLIIRCKKSPLETYQNDKFIGAIFRSRCHPTFNLIKPLRGKRRVLLCLAVAFCKGGIAIQFFSHLPSVSWINGYILIITYLIIRASSKN